jgi:hypothetical protein
MVNQKNETRGRQKTKLEKINFVLSKFRVFVMKKKLSHILQKFNF